MPTRYATHRAFTFVHLLIVLAIVLSVLLCLLVPAILKAREAARASACVGHMNQLQMALFRYEEIHGHFPAAYEVGPEGQPWHSWRIQMLPLFEDQAVYELYRFDEPWDGPNNRLLANKIDVERFQCSSGIDAEQTYMTNYAIITGRKTIFPGAETTKLSDISDGLENTILLVETHDGAIHWMEPRDVRVTTNRVPLNGMTTPSISSPHPAGPGVGFANGIRVRRLPTAITPQVLYKLSTIAGGEATTQASVFSSTSNNK